MVLIIIIITTAKCVLIYNPKIESFNECVCAKCTVTPKWLWERTELTHLKYLLLFSHRSGMHKCGYNLCLNRISCAFERIQMHSFVPFVEWNCDRCREDFIVLILHSNRFGKAVEMHVTLPLFCRPRSLPSGVHDHFTPFELHSRNEFVQRYFAHC